MRNFRFMRDKRGMVLILVAIALIFLLATVGFAIDMTRILTTKNQVKVIAEAAALAAVLELDGTATGLENAHTSALNVMGNHPSHGETNLHLDFAAVRTGPWQSNPKVAAQARFVRATVRRKLGLVLVSTVNPGSDSGIAGIAVAEQRRKEHFSEGLFPYSVEAFQPNQPDFGLTPGQIYTLRWAQEPSLEKGNVCVGDASPERIAASRHTEVRAPGFIEMVNRGNIRQSILYDYQTQEVSLGGDIRMTGGVRMLELQAVNERIEQDTDPTATRYETYAANNTGNGRRIVAIPIRDNRNRVLEIAAFFLPPSSSQVQGVDEPFCAEYVGPYLQGARRRAATGAGYYIAALAR